MAKKMNYYKGTSLETFDAWVYVILEIDLWESILNVHFNICRFSVYVIEYSLTNEIDGLIGLL